MEKNYVFHPLTLPNQETVKNRFFKSAMSESMAKNHQPNTLHYSLYSKWAQGGAAIIVTGNVMVNRNHLGEPGNVVLDSNSDLSAFKQWANSGSQNNAKIWMQINHPGKQSPRSLSKTPLAPSAIRLKGGMKRFFNTPKALTNQEVKSVIQDYIHAAKLAEKSGFHGVQIHAAHGYLVNQFLSPADNQRADEYGGDIENRMRFLTEIFNGIKAGVNKQFSIAIKLNSKDFIDGGFSEQDSISVIKRMSQLGIDLIEISGGNYENPVMSKDGRDSKEEGFFIEFAKQIQDITTVPIVITGGFRTTKVMNQVLENSLASMIGLARPLALYPDIPNQIENQTYTPPKLKRLTTRVKSLDKKFGSIMGIVYYEQQMKRVAKGKPPKIHTNAFKPLLHTLFSHGPTALKRRRAK